VFKSGITRGAFLWNYKTIEESGDEKSALKFKILKSKRGFIINVCAQNSS
jgi:hypothetical protein